MILLSLILAGTIPALAAPLSTLQINTISHPSNSNSTTDVPPNPFVWRPNPVTEIEFRRKPKRASPGNPGVSIYNFENAIMSAGRTLAEMQVRYHASPNSPVPGNHFHFEERIRHPGPGIIFHRYVSIKVDGKFPGSLEYGHVHLVMLGLLNYVAKWVTQPTPSARDLVYMCNFTYYWIHHPRYKHEIAEGKTNIEIRPANVDVARS
ncbi:MAG: hypothetical protein L6R40_006594 [Gallowayella cf. fulva]|nr:MAG: hypothetical protein L6R40_006594 [Xanthomendoza cf. fulva]